MRVAYVLCVLLLMMPPMCASELEILRLPEAGLCPQMAVDGSGTVHVIYLTGDVKASNIRYISRAVGQTAFSKPITVNSVPNSAMAIGGVRAPDMAVSDAGDVHVLWMYLEKGRGGVYASSKRAKDSGFSKQSMISGKTDGLDAGVSVAVSGNDVYAIWPAHGKGNAEAERLLYVAHSKNNGKSYAEPKAMNTANPGICVCCNIDAGVDKDGKPWVVYRNVVGNQRNTVLLSFQKDAFELQTLDTWQVNQCPMSSFYIGSGETALIAWQTADQVYWSTLANREPGEKRPALGMGKKRKHPLVVQNKLDQYLMVFSEGTAWNKGGKVEYHLMNAAGELIKGDSGKGLPAWSKPAAVALPNNAFLIAY